MIFRPELADAVVRGEKTVTRRLCSDNPRSPWWRGACGYDVGQVFAVQPGRGKHAIAEATIVDVARIPLGHLSDEEARREGFASAEAFEQAFGGINGGDYNPDAEVWRIELAVRVGTAAS